VTLTIVGGGVPEARIRAAFPESAQPRVTVVDRAREDEVIAAYRTHDVLVFPSTYEGFGMVLIEAMSQRLPVVSTPVGCATTVIDNEKTGLLVPSRDSRALADALAQLLTDPQLRTRLADEAFRRVRGMTWTETARATLEIYQRTIGARPAFAHA
jgi:glycosyltransferase involved in cell wall biosynthesis